LKAVAKPLGLLLLLSNPLAIASRPHPNRSSVFRALPSQSFSQKLFHKEQYPSILDENTANGDNWAALPPIMHTIEFILLLSEAVLVLDCLFSSTSTSTKVPKIRLHFSGSFQVAARLSGKRQRTSRPPSSVNSLLRFSRLERLSLTRDRTA